ncbi:MAG: aldehyde dehydrogenase [Chitinophagaceae bacterium]|nr:aldehyde dehydrogenase [Chitinophagaceae bacterium]
MNHPSTSGQLKELRRYFESHATRSYKFRLEQLKNLKKSIVKHEQEIYQALFTDLHKSAEECWVTENGLVLSELNGAIRDLRQWMEPESAGTNLLNLPSGSRVMREPFGVVLIIGPWNYPFQLLMSPLIGAIAAGNCVVFKPSEFAPATAGVMKSIIDDIFPPEYIFYVEGDGATVIPSMMNDFRFDHVFYTGSTSVGRLIYKLAADKLVPVTLELGGKSPCVVESDANIKVAARRIAMTKFSNAGQMCVAPDYVLVHESKKVQLVKALQETLQSFFGKSAEESYNYGRIINEKQFDRITGYLSQGKVVYGGGSDRSSRFIEPTILTDIHPEAPIMKDEIFGPVLPVIGFSSEEEAKEIIKKNPDPLAFYVFTSSTKKEKAWLEAIPFGGGCVNNASWHLTNHHLPFGGRGFSGIGSYHGKFSFETFSHKKAIMKTPTWFDPSIKYPPFKGKLKLFKWVIR